MCDIRFMENINTNTNTTPLIGTKSGWGKIFIAYLILGIAVLLVKGCGNKEQEHLFIIKEATSWN